jgi:hypothetical protein
VTRTGSLVERIIDRVSLAFRGGARVRVLEVGETPCAVALGSPTGGLKPEKLRKIVLELARSRGTVHVVHRDGRWIVRTSGELSSPSFEQRLRNVIGNA